MKINATIPEKNIVALGLAGTGKTTFLAALWNVVESRSVTDSLRAARLGNDVQHLNEIRDIWLECREFMRTGRRKNVAVTLHLHDPSDRVAQVTLTVPDALGEGIHDHFKQRTWPSDFQDQVVAAAGVLVFVHPSQLDESHYLPVLESLIPDAVVEGEAQDPASPMGADEETPVPWAIDLVDTPGVLVDLLQQIVSQRKPGNALPVSVVVSAWDVVSETDPDVWLAEHMPLLDQFLKSQPEVFRMRVFGVSAQGGSLSDRQRLLEVDRPTDRIKVIAGGSTTSDITAPIRWLLAE